MPKLTIAELEALMDQGFPGWRRFSEITALGEHDVTLRMPFRQQLTRPGGTISGPSMMALADTAAYLCTLAHAGPVVSAATASLDIHFLARPAPVEVTAIATLLRLGGRLSVCAVDLWSAGDRVAHATVTYALPPPA